MNLNPVVIGLAVVAAIAIVLIAYAIAGAGSGGVSARIERYVSPARRQKEEKRTEASPSISELFQQSEALSQINKAVEQRSFGATMARDLARADLHLRVSEYILIIAGCTVGVPLLLLALSIVLPTLGNPLFLIIGAVVGFLLPRFYVGRRKKGRLNAFNKQLPDTITLIANALRAGSSFLQAIELVTREARPPVSIEFARVIREVNLGLPFDSAMENMVRRVRSDDLELMVTAITIQHQVGGNLAEIMDSIAYTIRERIRIKGEIRVLTAQGRMSGYVVAGLPIGIAALLFVIAPSFMEPMFSKPPEILGLPAGVIILAFGAFMMAIGFILVRRIVDIQV
jgi:tight adherence protein B